MKTFIRTPASSKAHLTGRSLRRAALLFTAAASTAACGDAAPGAGDVGPGQVLPPDAEVLDLELRSGTLLTTFPDVLSPMDDVIVSREGRSMRFGVRQLRYVDGRGNQIGQLQIQRTEAVKGADSGGSSVVYRNVSLGADLVYRVGHGEIEQLLMLNQRPPIPADSGAAALELVEQVDFSGLELWAAGERVALPASLTTSGPLELRADGRTLFRIPTPEARDASPSRARRALGFKLGLSAEGKGALATVVQMDYLQDPMRQYPVAVDPSVIGHPCDVDQHCDDENPCTLEQCLPGGCVYTPNVAADGSACWGSGLCVTDPIPMGTAGTPDAWCVFQTPDPDQLADCTIGGPVVCRDGNPCTLDQCNAMTKECENPPNHAQVGQPCWTTGICEDDGGGLATGECVERDDVECVPSGAASVTETLDFEDVAGPVADVNSAALALPAVIDGVEFNGAGGGVGNVGHASNEPNGFVTGDLLRVVLTNQVATTAVIRFPAPITDLSFDAGTLGFLVVNQLHVEVLGDGALVDDFFLVDGTTLVPVSVSFNPPVEEVVLRFDYAGAIAFGIDNLEYTTAGGGPTACSTGNPCADEVCVCDNPPLCNRGHCEVQNQATYQGDDCWGNGTCNAGVCVLPPMGGKCGGPDLASSACDDGNPCTADSCDDNMTFVDTSDDACVSVACTNGDCDGNMQRDVCWQSGMCTDGGDCWFCGLPGLPGCDDSNPCTVDSCMGGVCDHDSVANGTACLVGGQCNAGLCVIPGSDACGGPNACNDGNPCTADSCTPGGTCQHAPIAPGTQCWGTGSCQASQCVFNAQTACTSINGFGGGAMSCEDGNPCTADACEPDGSCSHTPINIGGNCWQSGTCTPTGVCTF